MVNLLRSPLSPTLVSARVKSILPKVTRSGSRLYAVFVTDEGQELGLWAPADHSMLSTLHSGDQVLFSRDVKGSHHLLGRANLG
jgi:hypothetical protein